jgi:hypothetical protein
MGNGIENVCVFFLMNFFFVILCVIYFNQFQNYKKPVYLIKFTVVPKYLDWDNEY